MSNTVTPPPELSLPVMAEKASVTVTLPSAPPLEISSLPPSMPIEVQIVDILQDSLYRLKTYNLEQNVEFEIQSPIDLPEDTTIELKNLSDASLDSFNLRLTKVGGKSVSQYMNLPNITAGKEATPINNIGTNNNLINNSNNASINQVSSVNQPTLFGHGEPFKGTIINPSSVPNNVFFNNSTGAGITFGGELPQLPAGTSIVFRISNILTDRQSSLGNETATINNDGVPQLSTNADQPTNQLNASKSSSLGTNNLALNSNNETTEETNKEDISFGFISNNLKSSFMNKINNIKNAFIQQTEDTPLKATDNNNQSSDTSKSTASSQNIIKGITAGGQESDGTNSAPQLIKSEIGIVAFEPKTPLPPLTKLQMEIIEPPILDKTIQSSSESIVIDSNIIDDVKGWKSLDDAIDVLKNAGLADVATRVQNHIPANNHFMMRNMMSFIDAVKTGDIANWLPQESLSALSSAGEKGRNALNKLEDEVKSLHKKSERISKDWRMIDMPFQSEAKIQKVTAIIRREQGIYDDGSDNKKSSKNKGNSPVRFVINISLKKLGNIQFDGLANEKERSFNLVIRFEKPLAEEHNQKIRSIFRNSLIALRYNGNLNFDSSGEFFKPDVNKTIESDNRGFFA